MNNNLPILPTTLEQSMSNALVQAAHSHRFADLSVVRATADVSMRGADPLLKLALAEVLQTSLDLESLLDHFEHFLQQHLAIDGLRYLHEFAEIDLALGCQMGARFSCSLVTASELVGDLTIIRSAPFTTKEREFAESLIDLLVYPLRNALKFREALTAALKDPLTGAGNRIALTSSLHHDLAINKRYPSDLAILMLDMDDFKNINDMFGHSCGDEVLINTVDLIKEDIRGSDAIYRYGGEEFVIVLPNTPLEESIHIAERLRAKIEGLTLQQDGIRIITTSSIGISMLQRTDTISSLLNRADKAMYEAKASGRNQVCVAGQRA